MEVVSVTMARVAALLEVQSLDPFGKSSDLDAIKRMVDRYTFEEFPTTLKELDFQKGVELLGGKLANININKLTILLNGLVIDTRSSTEDSEAVLNDLIKTAHEAFGAVVKPSRVLFTSQITFRSELKIVNINPKLQPLADRVSSIVSRDMGQEVVFEPTAMWCVSDLTKIKINPGAFTIDRRAEAPFSDNMYFSSAPVRTPEHLELVKQLEAILLGG